MIAAAHQPARAAAPFPTRRRNQCSRASACATSAWCFMRPFAAATTDRPLVDRRECTLLGCPPAPCQSPGTGLTIRRDQDVSTPAVTHQLLGTVGTSSSAPSARSPASTTPGPSGSPGTEIASTLTLTTVEPRSLLRYRALKRRRRFTSNRGFRSSAVPLGRDDGNDGAHDAATSVLFWAESVTADERARPPARSRPEPRANLDQARGGHAAPPDGSRPVRVGRGGGDAPLVQLVGGATCTRRLTGPVWLGSLSLPRAYPSRKMGFEGRLA